jgi:hypothetical protein
MILSKCHIFAVGTCCVQSKFRKTSTSNPINSRLRGASKIIFHGTVMRVNTVATTDVDHHHSMYRSVHAEKKAARQSIRTCSGPAFAGEKLFGLTRTSSNR